MLAYITNHGNETGVVLRLANGVGEHDLDDAGRRLRLPADVLVVSAPQRRLPDDGHAPTRRAWF